MTKKTYHTCFLSGKPYNNIDDIDVQIYKQKT